MQQYGSCRHVQRAPPSSLFSEVPIDVLPIQQRVFTDDNSLPHLQ